MFLLLLILSKPHESYVENIDSLLDVFLLLLILLSKPLGCVFTVVNIIIKAFWMCFYCC